MVRFLLMAVLAALIPMIARAETASRPATLAELEARAQHLEDEIKTADAARGNELVPEAFRLMQASAKQSAEAETAYQEMLEKYHSDHGLLMRNMPFTQAHAFQTAKLLPKESEMRRYRALRDRTEELWQTLVWVGKTIAVASGKWVGTEKNEIRILREHPSKLRILG